MKKLASWMILSTWILYVFVPIMYRIVYGNYPENLQSMGFVPDYYQTKAAIIITSTLLVCLLIIQILPIGRSELIETVNHSILYYYVAIFIFILLSVGTEVHNFANASTGGLHGTFIAYYSIFFSPVVLFVVSLFCIKKKGSIILLLGSYLLLTILSNSRSGAVHIGIYLVAFCYASGAFSLERFNRSTSAIYKKYHRQIKIAIVILAVLAPVVYIRSTESRGSIASDNTHTAMEVIAARCSCLDEAGLALYTSEQPEFKDSIFFEKYGFIHQISCIIDSTIPGAIFGEDVDPNQYYRTMVGYMSEEDASRYYSSVNLMLPIYMILKYGLILGAILSVFSIITFYIIVSKLKNPIWKVFLIVLVFTEMIYYFDWVMVWKSFFKGAITIILFEFVAKQLDKVSFPKVRKLGIHLVLK